LYYTTTASAAPTAGNLVAGELAINTTDGKLYYKDTAGVVQTLASKDANSGSFVNLAYTGTLTGGTGIIAIGTNQIYKDASGNVGISTASPSSFGKFAVQGAASTRAFYADSLAQPVARYDDSAFISNGFTLRNTGLSGSNQGIGILFQLGTGGTAVNSGSIEMRSSADYSSVGNQSAAMSFSTVNAGTATERMRITSTGDVGIGTSSPAVNLHISKNTGVTVMLSNSSTSLVTNNVMGNLDYTAGTANTTNARISGLVVGTSEAGGSLVVETRPDGGSLTERVRIESTGSALIANSRFSPTSSLAISNYYNEEKLYQISQGGSTANYDICTVTSAYTYGTLVIEVSGTIQYAGADQRTASNRKSIIQFKTGSITVADLYTNYVGSFGTINFTYVSDGVIKINVTGATTGVGQGNGIAWVKVIGGNNSSGSTVTPLGFTLS
jgi:hypothetical protein